MAANGQTVGLRVWVAGGSNTLYYQHSDKSDSTAPYFPFGDWHTKPTAGLTDIGYTGHRHNNMGSGTADSR
jgi:hypothetical protein